MIRPLAKPVDEWRRSIIESAQFLFMRDGFEKTSIDNIMIGAGAAKGTFYRHFDSKDDVLKTIVDIWAEQYAKEIIDALRDGSLSTEKKVSRILEVVGSMAKPPDGSEAFFSGNDKTLALGLQKKMIEILAPELGVVLEAAKSKGEIDVSDPLFCTLFIIHGALGVLNASGNPTDANAISKLKEIVMDILHLTDKEHEDER